MNNKENKLFGCAIVCDLLPLYHDGVVSEKTAKVIDKHLEHCENCIREYDDLCAKMPEFAEPSTKKSFSNMMKNKRIKQKIITFFACIISCLILASSYYILTEVNLVNVPDVTVHRVYRYKGEDRDKFFVIYSTKNMSAMSPEMKITEKGGKTVFDFNWKRPIIAKNSDDTFYSTGAFEANAPSNNDGQNIDCDLLYYGGKAVWSKENNNDNKIPDYVYAFEEFENGNQDEFGNSDSISWSCGENFVAVHYEANQRMVKWNLDGEVVFDSNEGKSQAPSSNK